MFNSTGVRLLSSQIQDMDAGMNDYQREQKQALDQVTDKINIIKSADDSELVREIASYLQFRQTLGKFMSEHFGRFCSQACFQSQTSACCSRDGIITFWSDLVINVFVSARRRTGRLAQAIENPLWPHKCIYLGPQGCLWEVPPLGCALFLCDAVQAEVLDREPSLKSEWENLKRKGMAYRWPDRPVLFDRLEQIFMAAGCRSPLMYINTSPGLLRIKRKSGLSV